MRYIIGLFIVILGVGLLLETYQVNTVTNLFDNWWPVIIIAFGLLSWNSNRRNWVGPAIVTAVGMALLLENLGIITGDVWNYIWPLIVIIIGLRVIFGHKQGSSNKESGAGASTFVAFSGVDKRVIGKFTGGSVNAIFGGAKIDLREADIQEGAEYNVMAAFGGVDVLLPKSVKPDINIMPLFGGASNKTHPDGGATKEIKISGTALFGGVEVKN